MRAAPLLLALSWGAAHAAPTTYTLTPATALVVKVYKDRSAMASGVAHDHVIAARTFEGTVTYDPAAPRALAVAVTVDARALDVDPPRLRLMHGLESTLDADDRAKVKANMQAEDQLDVAHHPRITFTSKRADAVPGGPIKLTGDFSLRGVTRSVTLPVTLRVAPDGRLRGEGTLRIYAQDYGFKPYSAMLGAVRNAPHMDLVLQLVAAPTP